MSEYWKSQPKFYCKFCKVWIADNKPTKLLHESGNNHKFNVEQFHKQNRELKLHGARSERELAQQLQEIEKSAKLAIQADREQYCGTFYQNISLPPPPPPQRTELQLVPEDNSFSIPVNTSQLKLNTYVPSLNLTAKNTQNTSLTALSAKAIETISENLREDSSGSYSIKGITYLEGQFHEEKLKTGSACEIFVESIDEWIPSARIVAVKEIAVPHTTITLRKYRVAYSLPPSSTSKENNHKEKDQLQIQKPQQGQQDVAEVKQTEETDELVEEDDVKSDRLRIILNTSSHIVTETGVVVAVKPRVESTGLGVWQTVSVKLVNEVEEAKLEALRLLQEEAEGKLKEKQKKSHILDDVSGQMDSDNALSTFDPYNTGYYKGVAVGVDVVDHEIDINKTGATVGFKKRKAVEGEAKNIRAFRKKS